MPGEAHQPSINTATSFEYSLEPVALDLFRFLYRMRVKLTLYFVVVFAVGAMFAFYSIKSAVPAVEEIIALRFKRIEKREYPNGNKFSVEDLLAADILSKALAASDISPKETSVQDAAAHIYISKYSGGALKQDDGISNEYKISVDLRGLSAHQRIRLCDAIVNSYREQLRTNMKPALAFTSTADVSYDRFAANHDPLDVPELLRENSDYFKQKISDALHQSLGYPDSRFSAAFRSVLRDLDTWDRTRLEALEALAYQGQWIRNRDIEVSRIQDTIQKIDIQLKQRSQQINDDFRLLENSDRWQAMPAGQTNSKDDIPAFVLSVLDKIFEKDTPLIDRIFTLQESIETLSVKKARLERLLRSSRRFSSRGSLSAEYREAADKLYSEFNAISANYDLLLDEYLSAAAAGQVVVRQRARPVDSTSYGMILAGLLVSAVLAALFAVMTESLISKIRKQSAA